MAAAYAALPDEIKAKLEGARTVNVNRGRAAVRDSPKGQELEAKKKSVPVFHPLVRTHPENGRKSLWFHTVKMDHVTGFTPEETGDLLADLLEKGVEPEFVYRHKWRKGDMLNWDNRQAMHQAHHDYDPAERRVLHRLLLEGDRPVQPDVPVSGSEPLATIFRG